MQVSRTVALAVAILSCAVCLDRAADAATLRAVIVIEDDYDDPGLNDIAPSTRMDYGYVSKLLETLDAGGVMDVEKILVEGREATRSNVASAISSVDVDPDDVLFVYFSGHGGMEGGETFLATSEGGYIDRGELESMVRARGARLGIVLTDACSSSIDGLGTKSTIKKQADWDLSGAYVEVYRNLFLNYEGLLYVTAATEGEYAWGGSSGGNFTQSMVYETLLQDPRLEWQEVYELARARTQEKFEYMMNVGIMSWWMINDLQEKGITGEHPKAYSLPSRLGEGQVAIDDGLVDSVMPPDEGTAGAGATVTAVITNSTKRKVVFWVDRNHAKVGEGWTWDSCTKYRLKRNASLTVSSEGPIDLFFDDRGGDTDFYQIDSGDYVFEEDSAKRVVLLKKSDWVQEDDEGTASTLVGDWYWEIWDEDAGSFLIVVMGFREDGTVSLADESGNQIMWGEWKSKVKKHVEWLYIEITDGSEVIEDRMAVNSYDPDTILLVPSTAQSQEDVIMLYRIPEG